MQIDIYSSAIRVNKYLAVQSGTDVTAFAFPSTLGPDFKQLSPFKSHHEIISGQSYVALDADDVINNIQSQGYATFQANITVKVME